MGMLCLSRSDQKHYSGICMQYIHLQNLWLSSRSTGRGSGEKSTGKLYAQTLVGSGSTRFSINVDGLPLLHTVHT